MWAGGRASRLCSGRHEDRRAPSPRQEAARQWPLQEGPSAPAPAAQHQGSYADPAGQERVPASGNRECLRAIEIDDGQIDKVT